MSDKTAKRRAERFRQMQRQLAELQQTVSQLTGQQSTPETEASSASWRWQPYDWSTWESSSSADWHSAASSSAVTAAPAPPTPPPAKRPLPAEGVKPQEPAKRPRPAEEVKQEIDDQDDIVLIAFGRKWEDEALTATMDAVIDCEFAHERWNDFSTFACSGFNGQIVLEAFRNRKHLNMKA